MEEKNKKNGKGMVASLVLALVVILGLVMYICYDKGILFTKNQETTVNKKNENEIEESEIQEQTVDINSELVQNLYNIFRMDKGCYMTVDGLNNDNLVKLRIAYDNISKQNIGMVECSKLDLSTNRNEYCGSDYKNTTGVGSYTRSVNEDVIEAKVHELFGSDYKVSHASFDTAGHTVQPSSSNYMKYDAANHLYASFNAQGGGTCGGASSQTITSATKKKDELYIVTTFKNIRGNQSKISYTFKKDSVNENYVFVKAISE